MKHRRGLKIDHQSNYVEAKSKVRCVHRETGTIFDMFVDSIILSIKTHVA